MVGAISLGALITGDIESAKSYHLSLRHHLGDLRNLTDAAAVPSLALAALYWQHQGEDELKAKWVEYARRALSNVQVGGGDFQEAAAEAAGGARWVVAVRRVACNAGRVEGLREIDRVSILAVVHLGVDLGGSSTKDLDTSSPEIDSRKGRIVDAHGRECKQQKRPARTPPTTGIRRTL